MEPQERYKLNEDGVKEKDGFKCSSNTKNTVLRWCAAVKITDNAVQIRDTKDSDDTTLTFSHDEWEAFIKGVKNGEFDIA